MVFIKTKHCFPTAHVTLASFGFPPTAHVTLASFGFPLFGTFDILAFTNF